MSTCTRRPGKAQLLNTHNRIVSASASALRDLHVIRNLRRSAAPRRARDHRDAVAVAPADCPQGPPRPLQGRAELVVPVPDAVVKVREIAVGAVLYQMEL